MYSCVAFRYLTSRESFNVWLYYVTFVAILRHRPPPSSSAVMVVRRRRHRSSSAMPNELGHRPVNHSASPSAQFTHRRRCPEPTPGAQKTSITSPSAIFSSLGSRYPSRNVETTIVHACNRASQPYTACKLTAPP